MSRSALWRQEGNVKERERRAEEIFLDACAEGRSRSKSTLPLWGPDNDTFHFNPLLLQNTIHSPYFQKCCTNLKDWNAIIDEIYYEVKHVQVFQMGKQPSSAFCLLLRLLCFRMTLTQLEQTISHVDSPYIRAIGFLFIRYGGCPPEQVSKLIEPYLQDEEEFTAESTGKHRGGQITIGEFVRKLFQGRDYQGSTPLPRFPINVERDLQVMLLSADKVAERAQQHYKNSERMKFFETLGSKIRALYGDEENPVTWYDAVVDRVITRTDDGYPLKHPKFVVTFPEYGNTETVTLGEIDVIGGSDTVDNRKDNRTNNREGGRGYDDRKRGRGYGDRGRGNREYDRGYNDRSYQRGATNEDLYEEVRRSEREAVTSSSNWARRPHTTKQTLATEGPRSVQDRFEQRKQPPSASLHTDQQSTVPPQPKKRTAEEMAMIAEKKQKLLSKYG